MKRASRERAILVGLELKGRDRRGGSGPHLPEFDIEESLEELSVLAESAGAQVVERVIQVRESTEASTLIGSGKLAELVEKASSITADLVLFDRDLTPTQLRNLERVLPCKVLDRTQLILDIFASRARTREGQLQVELAQLSYLLPRLAGRGTTMSRLGGGIGTRGPGETQLETDRRRIFTRIAKIKHDLESVRTGRGVQRRQRQSVPLATISLAGYTNAGKSTVFNRLTGADVLADAKMFATLDPVVRQFVLPSNRRVLLSDTVGFISNLPTTLVKAFRATLEEVKEAALILHVVDASSLYAPQHTAHVMQVLTDIEATSSPQLLVLNKTDMLPKMELDAESVRLRVLGNIANIEQAPGAVIVSAKTGEGFDRLLRRIDDLLPIDPVTTNLFRIPHQDGGSMHLLYEYARVIEKKDDEAYSEVLVETPQSVLRQLAHYLIRTEV